MKPLQFLAVGFELAILIIAGVFIGLKLDEHFKTNGILVALLLMLILTGWIIRIVRLNQKFERENP